MMAVGAVSSVLAAAGESLATAAARLLSGDSPSFLPLLRAEDTAAANHSQPHRFEIEAELPAFAEEATRRFDRLGISRAPPLRLKLFGSDQVVVDGDHPDRDRVEELFESHPELRDQFLAIAAAETARKWGEAELTGRHPGEFRFELGADYYRVEFE